MVKNILKISIVSGLCLFASGCSITKSPNPNGNYKITSQKLSVIQEDVNLKILESSQRIERQLQLLNDGYKEIDNKGIQANYKVPTNQNIKDITPEDVQLMIREGRTKNNPPKTFDMTLNKGVQAEFDKSNMQNFYEKPIQRESQRINLYSNIKNENNLNKVDLSVFTLDRNVELNGRYKTTDVLKTLSEGAGYKFAIKGENKNLNIHIKNFNGTIKEALILIGNQLGNKALVNVNMNTNIVTLEYK